MHRELMIWLACRAAWPHRVVPTMLRRPVLLLSLALIFIGLARPLAAEDSGQFDRVAGPFLKMHCVGCHGGDEAEADLNLDAFDASLNVGEQHDLWLNVAEMVRSEEMPPGDEPQPTAVERAEFLAWLQTKLDDIDCRAISRPGRVTIRRLNRTEYNNTIRDLLGVKIRPADDFPADTVGAGFDNIAEVMSLPTLLMEKYLEAAERIVDELLKNDQLRQKLITSRPESAGGIRGAAEQILEPLASRAFRRPVQRDELTRLVELVEVARQQDLSFDQSIGFAVQGVLVSPHFLFRIEDDPPPGESVRRLNDFEWATRLSYFLWSSMPDDELLQAAREGRLQDEEQRREQIARMLAHPKAEALVDNFAGQWLQLRELSKITPDPDRFPSFNEDLRRAMQQETRLFFQSLIQDDRSLLDLIDADYSFVNQQLAEHYGMTGVEGQEFRKVKLTDRRRGGVLTQASILTLTSNPTRTSPVKRGKWILENILGAPPPPPPPGVEELSEEDEAELLGSLRERMEQHRSDPSCSVCHRKMDALGFGFENFDAVGAWRETDGRFPIDPSGELPGKQQFQGPTQLRQLLKNERRGEFVRCVVEKTLTYALGRELESYDRCAVNEILRRLEESDDRFSSLVLGIVESEPFCYRESLGGK